MSRKAAIATVSIGVALVAAPELVRSLQMVSAPAAFTISVPGVPGPYCVYGIEKRLAELPEVAGVRVLWDDDEIHVDLVPGAPTSRERIEAALDRAEYPYAYSIDP